MKTLIVLFALMTLSVMPSVAQQTMDIDLWPNGLPNSNGVDKTQPYDDSKQNFKPSIRIFLPEADKADGRAVVCLPGGGYSHLATDHEGYAWAPFFNDRGIALIVLKYRMPRGHAEVPQSDVREAFRLVREHASEWNINPRRVGIMGSSAGGHLASTIATHTDSVNAPAFQILFYPVVTMNPSLTHKGSRNGFLGSETPEKEMVQLYSNEMQVTPSTPPAIMLLSDDDTVVPSPNSINYYLALKRNRVPASLHVYPSGGHGWGIRTNFKYHTQMMADLDAWLPTTALDR